MKTKITLLVLIMFTLTLFSQTKLDYKLDEFWNGSSWQNGNKTEYTYNTNNILTEAKTLNWQTSSYVNSDKNLFSYNSNNNIIEILYQVWNTSTNQWDNFSKQERIINGNNQVIELLDYDWSGGQWVNSYKTTASYISGNILNQTFNFFWDGSQWIDEERSNYNYNANNRIDTFISEEWNGSQWNNSYKEIYSYFGNGRTSEVLYQDWTGSQWEGSGNIDYQLDSNFNRVSEIEYDSSTNPEYKSEYTYDTSQLMSSFTNPFNDTLEIDLGFEDFPFINKLLQSIQSNFNNGVWEQSNRETYHYDNTASINDFSTNISIYPNPTTDILNIELTNSNNLKQVVIYDTLGKKVFTATKNQLNIQTLENGIYILEIETISGNIARKKIIKK